MYISDEGARPLGSAHPYAHLWDNNSNPVDELNRIMKVRKIALDNFSADNIKEGQPMANLENVLVPIYLLHRYQLEAASKSLGGLYYTYALKGDGQKVTEIVSADEQRKALDALLQTIKPGALKISNKILKLIPPQPSGYSRTNENFDSKTGLTFDPLSAAESAANLTVRLILNSDRAARLLEYHDRNEENPGLNEVIDKLVNATWNSVKSKDNYDADIQRIVDNVVLKDLINLSNDNNSNSEVRAITLMKLMNLKKSLIDKLKNEKNEKEIAHFLYAINIIDQYEKNPATFKSSDEIEIPAGQPIGSDNEFD
jgi:hypothetical protein